MQQLTTTLNGVKRLSVLVPKTGTESVVHNIQRNNQLTIYDCCIIIDYNNNYYSCID